MDEGLFKLFPEDQETKRLPWQSISGKLMDAIVENFQPFEPLIMDEYEGVSICPLRNFEKPIIKGFVEPHATQSYGAPASLDEEEAKRIATLKGNVIKGSINCYQAKKLEKICLVRLELVKRYYGNIITIWPADEYALPILIISMDENSDATHFFVDFMPLADCVMDSSYLQHYLDPLEPSWEKYKFIRDLPNFPDYEVNLYSWMRATASPYLITRRVPPNKPKGIRDDLLQLGVDYLKVYIDLWRHAEPQDEKYMSSLNQRKAKIREHFRTGKDPDGKFWWKGERYLGPDLTHSLITASY
ncbi:MAG: hypothetical protein AMJ42_06645 [Deltaproteobacteria bacterium DG_8]|nr:MAG: hypothetical protein AMJ42_06645 [Deltaproteobacteria bacterium DG_8]